MKTPSGIRDRRDAGAAPVMAYGPMAGFRSELAAQIAAYFVSQAGGAIEKLALAKLQYLTERAFLARYGRPLVYDELFSLPHGPICSSSLNGIDGKLADDAWRRVKAHGRDRVHGKKVAREELDEVSDAAFEVLERVWGRFGRMSASQLRAFTHDPANCPEYEEVGNRRLPIDYGHLLEVLGVPHAAQAAADIREYRRHEARFPL